MKGFFFFGLWPCERLRSRSVHVFKHMFLVFKQHYTYFYILFHPHVFLKNTKNVTRIILPNGSLGWLVCCGGWFGFWFVEIELGFIILGSCWRLLWIWINVFFLFLLLLLLFIYLKLKINFFNSNVDVAFFFNKIFFYYFSCHVSFNSANNTHHLPCRCFLLVI